MCKVENDDHNEVTNDVSYILEKPGKYQALQYLLACLPATFVSMICVNYVFVAGDVNYRFPKDPSIKQTWVQVTERSREWILRLIRQFVPYISCRVSECESTVPVFLPTWWPSSDIDRCNRPIVNYTTFAQDTICTNDSFTSHLERCTDWVYETNDTIVAELDLACQPWKVSFVGTIHGVGTIIAMVGSGWMCDRFGRKPTLIISAVACVMGNLKVLATSYNMYVVLEFIEGAITTGVYTAGTVIMTENSSMKTRLLAGVLFAYAIYFGEAIFAVIAMYVPNWKNLLHIICSPSILFIFLTVFLHESPRWQILNGKIGDAKKTLKRMAKMNNLKIDIEGIDKISEEELKHMFDIKKDVKREGYKDMFKSKAIVKRLVAGIVWRLAVSFIYYSLVVNSVLLPGNKYTIFLMTALTSFPGELLSMYLMNKFGRRKPLLWGFLICGLTSIISVFIPEPYKWVRITLFLIGKLVVSASYTGSVVYTMELFPTSVRGSCIGLCTLAACVGSMLAPLTPAMNLISPYFASVCYAALAILASALLLVTPETKGTLLLDTIHQVDLSEFHKQKKTGQTRNDKYDSQPLNDINTS